MSDAESVSDDVVSSEALDNLIGYRFRKTVIRKGTEALKPGKYDTITVHYVGRYIDGTVFDSSRERNEPFIFELGAGKVIKGWDLAIASMEIGEISNFTFRANYAYRESGCPPKIPPYSTLSFEIELIDFEGKDLSPESDKTIIRSVIQEGKKYQQPTEGSTVYVSVTGSHSGRVFFEKELSFVVGEGAEAGLPEGIDRAIRSFELGEKSLLRLRGSRFTYGSEPPAEYNLPANAELDFTVFLKHFNKVMASWELTGSEKLDEAEKAKERGTMFLKQSKYKLALAKYDRVEDLLKSESSLKDEEENRRIEFLTGALLNGALIYSKMNEAVKCIGKCNSVLAFDSKNVKALYRKAQALLVQNYVDEALKYFRDILEIEPENKAALQQIIICKNRLTELVSEERCRYRKMFNKLAQSTEEGNNGIRVDDAK